MRPVTHLGVRFPRVLCRGKQSARRGETAELSSGRRVPVHPARNEKPPDRLTVATSSDAGPVRASRRASRRTAVPPGARHAARMRKQWRESNRGAEQLSFRKRSAEQRHCREGRRVDRWRTQSSAVGVCCVRANRERERVSYLINQRSSLVTSACVCLRMLITEPDAIDRTTLVARVGEQASRRVGEKRILSRFLTSGVSGISNVYCQCKLLNARPAVSAGVFTRRDGWARGRCRQLRADASAAFVAGDESRKQMQTEFRRRGVRAGASNERPGFDDRSAARRLSWQRVRHLTRTGVAASESAGSRLFSPGYDTAGWTDDSPRALRLPRRLIV